MAALLASPLLLAQGSPSPGGTLDRIRAAGRLKLGYRSEARPFAYKDEAGQPAGYSVAVCRLIADAVKAEPGLSGTSVEWVPVTSGDRFSALRQGQIDLLCGAETETLTRRADAAFSIPVYPGGIGALVRADAPIRLRDFLAGRGQTFRPTWRPTATQVLQARAFSAIQGTTADNWLTARIRDLQVIADVSRVTSYNAGIQGVLDRKADVFFAERAVLLDTARRHMAARDLLVIDRLFTYEPLALAMAPGDERFRLLADRTLSRLYSSGEIHGLY
ncbi:MAG: amino acid ABC transporter substrate-binding protein, partial [Acidobacteriota bacterium]